VVRLLNGVPRARQGLGIVALAAVTACGGPGAATPQATAPASVAPATASVAPATASAAPSVTPAPTPAPTPTSSEPVTVTIWTAYGPQLQPAIDTYNKQLKAAGKNVTIVATELGLDSISDKFAVALTTGDVPDILDLDLVLAPKFTSQGVMTDITDRVLQAGFNDFNASFADQGVWNGKTYMIPFSADVSALYYSKAVFRKVGLDPESPPQTWEDFRAALDKIAAANLKTDDGQPVHAFAGTSDAGGRAFCDLPFLWTGGGNWVDREGKVVFDSPETKQAMQWLAGIYTSGGLTPPNPQSATWDDKMNAFYAGQAAVVCSGSYVVEQIVEKAPNLDYGLMLFPHPASGGDATSFIGGDVIGIPAGSKHPEEAWGFIQYALSKDIQVDVWAKSGLPPVRSSLEKNAYFDAKPVYYTFAKGLAQGQVPKTPHYQELYDPWKGAWDAIFSGTAVDAAVDEAAKTMRDIVSR
jgi:multiple sugar transport system substrate-binding protein